MILQISLDLPDEAQSVPLCRRAVRTVLQELSVEEARADEIELALSEAASNVIRHAYSTRGNRYRIVVICHEDRVCFQVMDEGRGFVRTAVPDPEDEQLGGWGVWLIEQLADIATIRTLPGGGCLLEAEFALNRPITIPPPLGPPPGVSPPNGSPEGEQR